MKTAEEFTAHCQEVISAYQTGELELHKAAARIYANVFELLLNDLLTPCSIKWRIWLLDIAEDYRTQQADTADWALVQQPLATI